MSVTTHAPKQIDPSASLHAESLGLAKSHGRLAGRRIIVVGAGQRNIIDEDPPIGNGRAMSVLFAREGARSPASTSTRRPPTIQWRRSRPKAARPSPTWSTSPTSRRSRPRGALREKARRARWAGAECRHLLQPAAAKDDGGSLGQGLCRQRAQPHAVRAEGAGDDVAGRRDHADLVDGEPARQWPQPGLRILQGRADRARPGDRPGRRGKGRSLQCDRAGIHRYPDGPRRQPPARRPRGDGAVRPPGHRLGGRLCCAVPDFE